MRLIIIGIVTALMLMVAPSASASRDSVWVDSPQPLHYQDSVVLGFDYSGPTANNVGPWLQLQCYVGDTLVLSDVRAGFVGGYGYGVPFQLGPTARWSSGAAECTGIVGHQTKRNFRTDASVDFVVLP